MWRRRLSITTLEALRVVVGAVAVVPMLPGLLMKLMKAVHICHSLDQEMAVKAVNL